MDFFEVASLTKAGQLLVIGMVAGGLYFLLNKYVFVPAENSVGLTAAA